MMSQRENSVEDRNGVQKRDREWGGNSFSRQLGNNPYALKQKQPAVRKFNSTKASLNLRNRGHIEESGVCDAYKVLRHGF
jgi:hypothetical protein